MKKILELRHKVFFNSKNINKKSTKLEWDEYDYKADHLIILNKNFNGLKLEAGRAFVHPEFRNGVTIDLLWRGLSKYAQKNKIRHLFGVSKNT